MGANTPNRARFLLTLSCGCRARARDVPRKTAYMVCGSGLGHGTKLRWISAEDTHTKRFEENTFLEPT